MEDKVKPIPPDVKVEITSEGMVKLTQPTDSGEQGFLVLHPDDLRLIFEQLGFLNPPGRSRKKRGAQILDKCPQVASQNHGAAFVLPEEAGTDRPHYELTFSD
jgi:hypothetical protein